MERWKKITCIVALYMFVTHTRPLEPFMTAYFISESDGDVTLSEVANTVEAIKTYSALFVAIIMLVTADYFQYKPNMIFLATWAFVSYSMLIGSPGATRVRLSNVGMGAMYNNNIMAFSYLYAQIEDPNDFKTATSIVVAVLQLGNFFGDVLSQIIVNASGGHYTVLPYCNMFFMFLAVILACLCPPIKRKHKSPNMIVANEKSPLLRAEPAENANECKQIHYKSLSKEEDSALTLTQELFINLKTSYSNPVTIRRCLWYIFTTGAYLQIVSNMNILYSFVVEKSDNKEVLTNGSAEAIVTLSAAAGAYLIGKVNLDWSRYCDIFIVVNTALLGVLVMSYYLYHHLIYIYITYVLYAAIHQASFVIVYAEIAKPLKKHCYSLILELNYFGALIITNIITLVLIQFNFMFITIPGRFLFIGGLYVILGIVYSSVCLFEECKTKFYCTKSLG